MGKLSPEEIEANLIPALATEGFEIVDLMYRREYGSIILRIFVDLPEGIGLEDCSRATKLIKKLPVMEDLDYDYLEISSPGTDRIIRKTADFARFAGNKVKIKCKPPYMDKRNYSGELGGLIENGINIITEDGETVTIPQEMVASVRLWPEE